MLLILEWLNMTGAEHSSLANNSSKRTINQNRFQLVLQRHLILESFIFIEFASVLMNFIIFYQLVGIVKKMDKRDEEASKGDLR